MSRISEADYYTPTTHVGHFGVPVQDNTPAPFVGGPLCVEHSKEGPCKARRAKDTEYCIWHLRARAEA